MENRDKMPPLNRFDHEQILKRAKLELEVLYATLVSLVVAAQTGRGTWQNVGTTLEAIRHLEADARMAGLILGMLSPWIPKAGAPPSRAPDNLTQKRNVALAIKGLSDLTPLDNGDEYRWPQLEDAIAWVEEQGIMAKRELALVQAELHRQAFVTGRDEDLATIIRLQEAVAESIRNGDSLSTFRKRIEDVATLKRHEVETIFRTNTKRAFLDGQEKALQQPRVKERFRWVRHVATQDNRTRPWHWFFDGWNVEVGTQEYYLIKQIQGEYSCRCALIALDEDLLNEYGGLAGVKTMADVPPEILAQIELRNYEGDRG